MRIGPELRLSNKAGTGLGWLLHLLCRWAHQFGIEGLGIDISTTFLTAAASRANELSVAGQVKFEQGDASATPVETGAFDIVSCIGATWIGSGIQGTVNLMRPALREPGLMLIGEPYWLAEPPPPAFEALKCLPDEFTTLWGTCQRLAATGLELVEMVLSRASHAPLLAIDCIYAIRH